MSVIGTKEGIYVYNDKMVFVKCHYYQKCMWCGKKYKEGDDVVDAMFETKEGYAWSGESIHRDCDDERYDATMIEIEKMKKEKRVDRLKFMLEITMK